MRRGPRESGDMGRRGWRAESTRIWLAHGYPGAEYQSGRRVELAWRFPVLAQRAASEGPRWTRARWETTRPLPTILRWEEVKVVAQSLKGSKRGVKPHLSGDLPPEHMSALIALL
jgi:hypothetical protein